MAEIGTDVAYVTRDSDTTLVDAAMEISYTMWT